MTDETPRTEAEDVLREFHRAMPGMPIADYTVLPMVLLNRIERVLRHAAAAPPEPPRPDLPFYEPPKNGREDAWNQALAWVERHWAAPPETPQHHDVDACWCGQDHSPETAPPEPPRAHEAEHYDGRCQCWCHELAGGPGHPSFVAAPQAQPLDVDEIIRIMDLSVVAEGDDQDEVARWIHARLTASGSPGDDR